MGKYKINDRVTNLNNHRAGTIVNIGYSEKSEEWLYIVEYSDKTKDKVLESNLLITPQDSILLTPEDFDEAVVAVMKKTAKDMEGEEALDFTLDIIGVVSSNIRKELFDN